MPYIKQERRGYPPANAGELNYAITRLIISYSESRGLNYQTINDVSGACTEALAEYRRRVTAAYEPMKIAENGDVYPATFPTHAKGKEIPPAPPSTLDCSVPEAEADARVQEAWERRISDGKEEA